MSIQICEISSYKSSFDFIIPVRVCNFLLIYNQTFSITLRSGDCAGQLILLILFRVKYS